MKFKELKLLLERSMEEIYYKNINDKTISNGEELKEIWKLFYELEYKYNMVSKLSFKGLEKRQENILKIIENTANPMIRILAKSLYVVLNKWMSDHKLIIQHPKDIDKIFNTQESKNEFLKIYNDIKEKIKILIDLKNGSGKPIVEQFNLINQILNTVHFTGTILEYYAIRFDIANNVDEANKFFNQLSNMNVEEWNVELRELGVEI